MISSEHIPKTAATSLDCGLSNRFDVALPLSDSQDLLTLDPVERIVHEIRLYLGLETQIMSK